MFEKAKSFSPAQHPRFDGVSTRGHNPPTGDAEQAFHEEDAAIGVLRALDWGELKARFAAARELRQVLQRDVAALSGTQADGLADAAARYFRTKDDSKHGVNPVALSDSKGSPCMISGSEASELNQAQDRGYAKNGDARED